MRSSLFGCLHFRTENRFAPRTNSGAGFFLKMLLGFSLFCLRRSGIAPSVRAPGLVKAGPGS